MKLNKYLEKNKPIIIKNYLKKNIDEKKKIIESINNSKENISKLIYQVLII